MGLISRLVNLKLGLLSPNPVDHVKHTRGLSNKVFAQTLDRTDLLAKNGTQRCDVWLLVSHVTVPS